MDEFEDNKFLPFLGDPLDRALDVNPMQVPEVVVKPREDGDDYQTAREGIHETIGKAATALNELMLVARVSQHPRAYEVTNQLLNTLLAGYKDLLKAQEQSGKGGGPKTVHNHNTLIMTGPEMIDMIKKGLKSG